MRLASANKGRPLERVILASQVGVTLSKVGQEAKRIGKERTDLIAVHGACDFFGSFSDGLCLLFDAKMCGLATRFTVGDPKTLKPHQRENLIRHGRGGACCGLLIEASALRRYYWCPFTMLANVPPSYRWDELWYVGPATHMPNWRVVRAAHDAAKRGEKPAKVESAGLFAGGGVR